jgi:competence protein ComEA
VRAVIAHIPPDARPWAIGLAVALLVAVAAILVGAGVFARGSNGSSTTSDSEDAAVAALPFAGTTPAPSTTPLPSALVVHAAGAVANPGLYRLEAGSRVGDLLTAAGGVAADGDLDRVNLAAVLVDGARVYVPRHGEEDIPALAEADAPSKSPDGSAIATESGPIDLNRATLEQLETLPGVGPSIAAAIVDHRERNGPFATVEELVDVRGIGPARLEQLRALVRV